MVVSKDMNPSLGSFQVGTGDGSLLIGEALGISDGPLPLSDRSSNGSLPLGIGVDVKDGSVLIGDVVSTADGAVSLSGGSSDGSLPISDDMGTGGGTIWYW